MSIFISLYVLCWVHNCLIWVLLMFVLSFNQFFCVFSFLFSRASYTLHPFMWDISCKYVLLVYYFLLTFVMVLFLPKRFCFYNLSIIKFTNILLYCFWVLMHSLKALFKLRLQIIYWYTIMLRIIYQFLDFLKLGIGIKFFKRLL